LLGKVRSGILIKSETICPISSGWIFQASLSLGSLLLKCVATEPGIIVETLIPSLRSIAAAPAGAVAAALAAGYTTSNLPASVAPYLPVYLAYSGAFTGGVNQYPTNPLTRTGYKESDLVDYNTKSIKSLNSIHYKLNSTVEASLSANMGSGTTVYTGSERYSIKNFKLAQYKAEIKGNDFYLRAYTTRENSGDSYNATALGSYLNEYYSPSQTTWVPTYLSAFTSKILPVAVGGGGLTADGANAFARGAADGDGGAGVVDDQHLGVGRLLEHGHTHVVQHGDHHFQCFCVNQFVGQVIGDFAVGQVATCLTQLDQGFQTRAAFGQVFF
jgi:hypothetical protein